MITNEPLVIDPPFNYSHGRGGGRFISTCFVSPIWLTFTQKHTATPDPQKSWMEFPFGKLLWVVVVVN